MLRKVTDGDVDMVRVLEECARTWSHLIPKNAREVTTILLGRFIRIADKIADNVCPQRKFVFCADTGVIENRRVIILSAWESES